MKDKVARLGKATLSMALGLVLATSLCVGPAFAGEAYTAASAQPGAAVSVKPSAVQAGVQAKKKKTGWNKAHTAYYRKGVKVTGLQKIGKNRYYFNANGKKAKRTWKTVGGKRYYFKANGRAATLSTKIKGAYYVFDKKGVLQNSKQAGDRLVTIGGNTYRVNKAGKAVAGWSSDGTQRFSATGLLLKGTWFVDGAFYAASATGVYDASRTAALNAVAKRGSSAAVLKALLGAPKQQAYSKSCNIEGDDGIWVYDHFMVTTARPTDTTVQEYVWSIEAR